MAESGSKPDVADVRKVETLTPNVESTVGVITGAKELCVARIIASEGGFEALEESAIIGARYFQSNDIAMGEASADEAVDGDKMQCAGAANDSAAKSPGVGAASVEIFGAPANEDGVGARPREEGAGEWGFVGEQAK